MRATIVLTIAALLIASAAHARTSNIPTLSKKTYRSSTSAAAGGGSYAINRRMGQRLKQFGGAFHGRRMRVTRPATGNAFKIQTRKLNPDNRQPLASTTVPVVRTRGGTFHFLHDRAKVTLNLPILLTHRSRTTAAKAGASRAMLRDDNVKRWFAHSGVYGADVMSQLRARVTSTSASGKTAKVRVYTRSNGQDGYPHLETTVTVRKQADGQWKPHGRASSLMVNSIWE